MAAIEDCKYKFYFINITGKTVFVHKIVILKILSCNVKEGTLRIETHKMKVRTKEKWIMSESGFIIHFFFMNDISNYSAIVNSSMIWEAPANLSMIKSV